MNPVQDKLTTNPKDATMLLIDRRSGLFNLVNDIPLADLCRNVAALAKVATLLKIPLIATAPVPDNPNPCRATGQLTDGTY
jgi:hypothetical protein